MVSTPFLLPSTLHLDLSPRFSTPLHDNFLPNNDPFPLDDLLVFPNEDDNSNPLPGDGTPGTSFPQPALDCSSLPTAENPSSHGCSMKYCSRAGAAASLQEIVQPSSGLCIPSDELAGQLEWLSNFVEDSSYTADTMLMPLASSEKSSWCSKDSTYKTPDEFQTTSPASVLDQAGGRPCFVAPSFVVPSRARSKRSRTGGRIWSLDTLIPTLVENRLGSDATIFLGCSRDNEISSSEQGSSDISWRPWKKSKEVGSKRCTHCLVQKTPQWRAGPMGPQTLCNACGVRYKSGRLVPEYRPAGSPSFVNEVHSNSHKRILEMRRLKELEASAESADGNGNQLPQQKSEPQDCHSPTESSEETMNEIKQQQTSQVSD